MITRIIPHQRDGAQGLVRQSYLLKFCGFTATFSLKSPFLGGFPQKLHMHEKTAGMTA
jgi:hypothetical protein